MHRHGFSRRTQAAGHQLAILHQRARALLPRPLRAAAPGSRPAWLPPTGLPAGGRAPETEADICRWPGLQLDWTFWLSAAVFSYYLAQKSFWYLLITMKRNRSHSSIFGTESHMRALRPDDDESKRFQKPQKVLRFSISEVSSRHISMTSDMFFMASSMVSPQE